MSDAELTQTYLAGIRAWAQQMGPEFCDQLIRDAQESMPLVDGLRAVFEAGAAMAETDAEYAAGLLQERDQARMHAETLYAALTVLGHDWPELPWRA